MDFAHSIFIRLLHEYKLFYGFTKSNLNFLPMLGVSVVVGTAGLKHVYEESSASLFPVVRSFVSIAVFYTLYLYVFDICGQLYAVEEDKINKPDRPLPSGQVTAHGARTRCIVLVLLFLSMGIIYRPLLGVIIVWLVNSFVLGFSAYGSHWFLKNNVGMAVGSWVFCVGTAILTDSMTDGLNKRIIFISLWLGPLMNTQDWRDIEGDRKVGRYTLPLAFGNAGSRWVFVGVMEPIGAFFLWKGKILQMAPVLLTALHVLLAYRSVRGTTYGERKYDNQTLNVSSHPTSCVATLTDSFSDYLVHILLHYRIDLLR